MNYLLIDRVQREADHLELWERILHPAYPRPVSPEMAKAVSEYDRRKRERRSA